MTPDYAEILRLYRKYQARPDEPLWVTFVMIGQQLERVKPERCKACFRTDLEYSRLVDVTCNDPWHGDDHLRAKSSPVSRPMQRGEGS